MKSRSTFPIVVVSGVLIALALSTVSVFASRFTDVPAGAWFEVYSEQAAELGIVSGYNDAYGVPTGRFGPGNTVTVAEALKISLESAGYDTNIGMGYGHWAARYVSLALGLGFQFPSGTDINIDRPATRAEVAAMMADAFKLQKMAPRGDIFLDVTAGSPYVEAIEALERSGVVTGDTDSQGRRIGRFRPANTIVRAEVVKMAMEARARLGTPGRNNAYFSSRSSHSSYFASSNSSFGGQCTIQNCGYPPGMPNWQCPDGTIGGPSCERLPDGRCGWLIRQCSISSRSSSLSSLGFSSSVQVQTHLVTYSGTGGFRPSFVVIKVGDTIRFSNESDLPMWVASNQHPVHSDYAGFDTGKTYTKGQEYQFTFTRIGTWGYHNHARPEQQGVIAVDPR